MQGMLERLWNEYLAEKCAVIEGEQEKMLAQKTLEKGKVWRDMLSKEQCAAVEKYIDLLCEIQESFVKKAFFKGCEFTAMFFLEVFRF